MIKPVINTLIFIYLWFCIIQKEFWVVRDNDACKEEELFCSGKVAVHSKGCQGTRVLQTSYTCETDIKHALWCTFHTTSRDEILKNSLSPGIDYRTGTPVECICLLDSYTLRVFTETGDDYVSSLQFQVKFCIVCIKKKLIWFIEYSILLQIGDTCGSLHVAAH